MASTPVVKTRICMISDTHNKKPFPADDPEHGYRLPLPPADVLLHAGDLTVQGYISEYRNILEVLNGADAELKIVIAGNHDITLDEEYYQDAIRRRIVHSGLPEDLAQVKELWTGDEAKKAGIIYLEEGVETFRLRNGATFTIYTSPYQPEFCDWAFPYERDQDRFNPAQPTSEFKAPNPIASWPEIDIMLTHGPPRGIRDQTHLGERAGCENLWKAVQRCRPRLHCFGHIHEGWGAERYDWQSKSSELVQVPTEQVLKERCAQVDIANGAGKSLKFGEETLFVNASIMNVHYKPTNAPWVVDLDLPLAEDQEAPRPK